MKRNDDLFRRIKVRAKVWLMERLHGIEDGKH